MEILASTAQMKELDRIAIEERGIPSLELMENAAQAVAQAVMDLVGPAKNPKGADGPACIGFMTKTGEEPTLEEQREMEELRSIVESKNTDPTQRIGIFCGPGNNGGDGVAAARILLEAGYRVRAFLVGDRAKMTPDERAMEEKLREAGGELESLDLNDQRTTVWMSTCDCFVDALFGVGLQRPLAGEFLTLVQWLNRMHTPVVSCDLPSGVHGDTGEILGDAVQAKVTVTFTCVKPGLYLDAGAGRAGEVRAVDIGIPWELLNRQVWRAPEQSWSMPGDVCRNLPSRPVDGHKGDFGKLFLLAGSEGYTGAPNLAARAALRTGAGLVFLGVPREIYPILAVKCDEAMPFPLPEKYEEILEKARGCDVALIGPGLGRHPKTEKLVRALLEDLDIPVVLDADGINALCGHIDILDKRSAPTVLTPPRRGVCTAHRYFSAGDGTAERCPLLCQSASLYRGTERPRNGDRRSFRPVLDLRDRQPGHGKRGLGGCAVRYDRRPVGAEAFGRAVRGPLGAGGLGGVVPRKGGGQVRPEDGRVCHAPQRPAGHHSRGAAGVRSDRNLNQPFWREQREKTAAFPTNDAPAADRLRRRARG